MRRALPLWRTGDLEVAVRFVGRCPPADRGEVLSRVEGVERPVAWLDQRHSARCRQAREGLCGEGDALWTGQRGLALCVATADCVPVALVGAGGVAVIHAGWRGIVAGVVPATVAALAAGEEAAGGDGAQRWSAWIGPAIGPCCYEVGKDVAVRVEAVSAGRVATPGARGRSHLDLVAAVAAQLRAAGVAAIERLGPCTRCSPDLLWSYRRDGTRAGRNLTFAWLRGASSAPGAG